MYKEDIRLLKQASLDNKLIIFVGAGVSVNSGIPTWYESVKKINDKMSSAKLENDDLLKVPQYYFLDRGAKEYNELVKSIFHYALL